MLLIRKARKLLMNSQCKLFKKIKYGLIALTLAFTLTGCEDLEQVELGYYKDKLYDGTDKLVIDTRPAKEKGNAILDYLNDKSSSLTASGQETLSGLKDKVTNTELPSVSLPGTNENLGIDEETGREKVKLNTVIDGDTLDVTLQDGTTARIRLIGCNTPESVAHEEYLEKTGKENTDEGKEASNFTKDYLKKTKYLWLEYDAELHDPYERTLAYVYTDKNDTIFSSLQAILLSKGYAEPMFIEPNVKYKTELQSIYDSYIKNNQ